MNKTKVSKKIFHFGNVVIRLFFFSLMTISFFAVLSSANWLPDAHTTTWLTYLMFVVLLTLLLSWLAFPKFQSFLKNIFIKHKWGTSTFCLIIALIWQIQFVYFVHPSIGFDVSAVHNALINPNSPNLRGYFSVNYNNLPILLTLHEVANIVHSTSWFTMAIFSTIVTDLSAIIIILTIAIINFQKLPNIMYILACLLSLFPICMIPYTDVWCLLPISFSILGWSIAYKKSFPLIIRFLGIILTGVSLACGTWIKPSVAVWGIAVLLSSLLYLLKNKKIILTSLFSITIIISFALTYQPLKKIVNTQHYIIVNQKRQIPMIHFINVGLTHDGAYDPKAALAMDMLPTKKQKVTYSKKMIKKRLQQRGILGYLAFLVRKQGLNTADGTFGWLHEGHFIISRQSKVGWKGFLSEFIYPNGKYVIEFKFITQILWTIIISLLLFGFQKGGYTIQTLRLALVGGFMFLLLFEGGRSRYLVQFIPIILILATLSTDVALVNYKRILAAIIPRKEEKHA